MRITSIPTVPTPAMANPRRTIVGNTQTTPSARASVKITVGENALTPPADRTLWSLFAQGVQLAGNLTGFGSSKVIKIISSLLGFVGFSADMYVNHLDDKDTREAIKNFDTNIDRKIQADGETISITIMEGKDSKPVEAKIPISIVENKGEKQLIPQRRKVYVTYTADRTIPMGLENDTCQAACTTPGSYSFALKTLGLLGQATASGCQMTLALADCDTSPNNCSNDMKTGLLWGAIVGSTISYVLPKIAQFYRKKNQQIQLEKRKEIWNAIHINPEAAIDEIQQETLVPEQPPTASQVETISQETGKTGNSQATIRL